jgi:hypothetical protein
MLYIILRCEYVITLFKFLNAAKYIALGLDLITLKPLSISLTPRTSPI